MKRAPLSSYAPATVILLACLTAVLGLAAGACSNQPATEVRPAPAVRTPTPAFRPTQPGPRPVKPREAEDSGDSPSRWRQKLRARYAYLA